MKEDEILKAFGKAIKKKRKTNEWSQETLAEKADLDRTYISSVERGHRNVSLVNIVKLASALEVTTSTLLENIGDIYE